MAADSVWPKVSAHRRLGQRPKTGAAREPLSAEGHIHADGGDTLKMAYGQRRCCRLCFLGVAQATLMMAFGQGESGRPLCATALQNQFHLNPAISGFWAAPPSHGRGQGEWSRARVENLFMWLSQRMRGHGRMCGFLFFRQTTLTTDCR